MWGYIRASAHGRKPGRYALSNLYMTNPNLGLPPALCSGITWLRGMRLLATVIQSRTFHGDSVPGSRRNCVVLRPRFG